ncbi:acyl-CoA transferase [Microbacterium mitrae]|uniref:Acyl-CoA transferase n=2 Tax=Microbacterium mitrae TaxID=664640 RepID=A0A5C8HMP4_9MICO|nr:acyl-CoA transferase [Microbacterium mitrae]
MRLMDDTFADLFGDIWGMAGVTGDAGVPGDAVSFTGPRVVLASPFDVTGLATGAVASATLAVARLLAERRGEPLAPVTVDSGMACAAFRGEALFSPIGWQLAPLWDPIAGNYRAADGWIRLHTNYAHHRAAVRDVLRAEDRDGVATAVAAWRTVDLETAIVAAGGAAAAMHARDEWLASPAGRATAGVPLLEFDQGSSGSAPAWAGTTPTLPLSGVRVLDLTRVIAGPTCTKVLAWYGADVLRIDPPGFEEVASLLPETTVGKRCAALDLNSIEGRAHFEALLAEADVIVLGLRGDALASLGYTDERLAVINPALIVARLNAYGWEGPWKNRRGFDSLVQMSCGIAADGAATFGRDEPTPLPVQALDYATGWFLAAAVARALTTQLTNGATTRISGSLVATANLLYSLPRPPRALTAAASDAVDLEETATAWGQAKRVPMPGRIAGVVPQWQHNAGPLARRDAVWNSRE